VPKKHIFLSYCRDNTQEVTDFYTDLIKAGEQVWWDQENLLPGQDWRLEISEAIKDAYAVLICFSKETEARTTTGIYPEARAAIEEYREYAPGDVFLIPVRLSECDIPKFRIDATLYLNGLQRVDLFPAAQRDRAFQKLIRSLQLAPNRPTTLPTGTVTVGTASTSTPATHSTSTVQQPASTPNSGTIALWQEKLEFLQQQEAIASDPAQKFALKKQIEEAKQKIQELGGR
jgi:hypothetical protein